MAPKLSGPLKPSDSHAAVVSSWTGYRRPLGWRSEVGELTVWGLPPLCVCVSCSVMSDSATPRRFLCPWNSPHKNTGVGCHFLLQAIFLTHGSNPGLLHCRQILYHLSHQESPIIHQFLKRTSVWTSSGQSLQCAAEESNLAIHATSCWSSDFQEPVSWLVSIQVSIPKCHNSNIHTIHPKLAVYESTTISKNKRPGVCVRFIPRCLAKSVREGRERQELEARKGI